MKRCATPLTALLYPYIRESHLYGEQGVVPLATRIYDTRHDGSLTIDLHLHILDTVSLDDQCSTVQFCPARRYPFEPLVPIQHASGTPIYVQIVLCEEPLKDGDIGSHKGSTKR